MIVKKTLKNTTLSTSNIPKLSIQTFFAKVPQKKYNSKQIIQKYIRFIKYSLVQ